MTNVVHSSPIIVTLMMEAISSFETAVFTRATRRNISEDCTLCSHWLEEFSSTVPKAENSCFEIHVPIRRHRSFVVAVMNLYLQRTARTPNGLEHNRSERIPREKVKGMLYWGSHFQACYFRMKFISL
jgi:hypothetical protein